MAFRRRAKSHPLFSQEFLIHNHADIGFCLVLSVLIALMFEVFSPQPADPAPWDEHRGLLGLVQTPVAPRPFPIPAVPLRHGP